MIMAGPYDYTVNIPQPPAQNFLQSLMGIRQLQQMEEQSAIQQQQAAIQQQNAAFQQQMQPLQLEAERARIGQIGQATATSAEALRQGKTQFEQAQADRELKTKYQNDVLELSKDPKSWTPEKLQSLAMQASVVNPSAFDPLIRMGEAIPKVQSVLGNVASDVLLSVHAGKPGLASESIDNYISGTQTSLEQNPNDPAAKANLEFLKGIKLKLDEDPEAAALAASNYLVNANPAKFDQISKALKGKAEVAETEAKTKKELAAATATKQEKQVDEEKRALDLKKESLQIKELEQKIDAGRADKVKIYASQNKEGYKLSEEIRNQTLQAEKAKDILQRIDSGEVKLPKNVGQSFVQYIQDKIPAFANDVSFLRTQYQALLAPEAKKNLPPGSASDADMKEARQGLLNKNATPKQFRKAVEIIGRISEDQAKYTEAKLAWISENSGSIGSAVKDLNVFGSSVPKGTPLNIWWTKSGKNLDPYSMSGETSPAAPAPKMRLISIE